MAGIQFLTRTGLMCTGQRQEFILLSDTLGLSMLTIALNHAKPPGCTEATVVGPFHTDDAPHCRAGHRHRTRRAGQAARRRRDAALDRRHPLAGAEVDVWQADDAGKYDVQYAGLTERRARAVLRSDAQGRVRFRDHRAHRLSGAHRRAGGPDAGGHRAPPVAAGASALHDQGRTATRRW